MHTTTLDYQMDQVHCRVLHACPKLNNYRSYIIFIFHLLEYNLKSYLNSETTKTIYLELYKKN